MKKILIVISVLSLFSCVSNNSTVKNFNLSIGRVMDIDMDSLVIPTQGEIDIIYYILQNTPEMNIHRMREEVNNQVFVHESGAEAVYDETGALVTNPYNKGSFNYYNYKTEPLKKFIGDTLPWLEWGNDRVDPTSKDERLYYYLFDLDIGLQTYIFEGRKQSIESIDITSLTKDELDVLKLFKYLIFNDGYEIKYNVESMDRLEAEGDFYWSYFQQIQNLLGLI